MRNRVFGRVLPRANIRLATAIWLGLGLCAAKADQVEMKNGDRYAGQIMSLTTNTVVLKSDVLGTVELPRAQVTSIAMGTATNTVVHPASAGTRALTTPAPVVATGKQAADAGPNLRLLADNPKLIQQVQAQFLGDADGAATAKFNELVGGMMSGKLNINDIRAEAKSAADQLRAARKELGDDSGFAVEGYLAILDNFLKDSASSATPAGATTNASPVKKLKVDKGASDE